MANEERSVELAICTDEGLRRETVAFRPGAIDYTRMGWNVNLTANHADGSQLLASVAAGSAMVSVVLADAEACYDLAGSDIGGVRGFLVGGAEIEVPVRFVLTVSVAESAIDHFLSEGSKIISGEAWVLQVDGKDW